MVCFIGLVPQLFLDLLGLPGFPVRIGSSPGRFWSSGRGVFSSSPCVASGFLINGRAPSTADSLRGYSFHAEMRRTRRERVEILVDHEDRKGARYTDGYVCILYVDM